MTNDEAINAINNPVYKAAMRRFLGITSHPSIRTNYVTINEGMCRVLLGGLAGYEISKADMDHDCSVLAKYAVSGMMMAFDEGNKSSGNIVLTSQTVGSAEGFQVHGIFPSFTAAAKYIAKDEGLGEELTQTVIHDSLKAKGLYEFVRPQTDGTEVHWCASITHIRNDEGL